MQDTRIIHEVEALPISFQPYLIFYASFFEPSSRFAIIFYS